MEYKMEANEIKSIVAFNKTINKLKALSVKALELKLADQ